MLQDKTDYIKEAVRLLSGSKTYERLKTDPLPKFTVESNQIVTKAQTEGILSKTEVVFCQSFFQVLYFYHLPKIYKRTDNPPGCPIVSITSSYSLYIDHFLQPPGPGSPLRY